MVKSASKSNRLDQIDRHILKTLTDQGRISNASLARSVGLSESATLERVRRLEKTGIIVGYSARIVPHALGQNARAIAHVKLPNQSKMDRAAVIQSIMSKDSVVAAYSVFGPYDLEVHVAGSDVQALDQHINSDLSQMDGVQIVETMMVTETFGN